MDPKALKKIADACRKAGIKHYKCADFEFTLSDQGPISNYKKRTAAKPEVKESGSQLIESDALSEEELLFWSTGANPTEDNESVQ